VEVNDKVYREFGDRYRISPDPLTCNCLILPDGTIAQLTDIALHLRYLRRAMSLESLRQLGTFLGGWKPFSLEVSGSKAVLSFDGEPITAVSFPQKSEFYEQQTSSGLPFLGNAVLQGVDTLAFQNLWPCALARAGCACQFCYTGGISEQLAKKHKPEPRMPTARDAAEIVDYAVNRERVAEQIQITGGSTMNPRAECASVGQVLKEIDAVAGLKNVSGEILVFTTPPSDPRDLDQVFDAGADRVACSLEVWDEKLAEYITPGKVKFTTRQRHFDALRYIAREYGPNKALSTFVVGLEPVESFLEGARALAREGIVAMASLWIPFGRPVMGSAKAPGLEYYQRVKRGLAEIYAEYGISPPGGAGFNVCICRDICRHKDELVELNVPGQRSW